MTAPVHPFLLCTVRATLMFSPSVSKPGCGTTVTFKIESLITFWNLPLSRGQHCHLPRARQAHTYFLFLWLCVFRNVAHESYGMWSFRRHSGTCLRLICVASAHCCCVDRPPHVTLLTGCRRLGYFSWAVTNTAVVDICGDTCLTSHG